MPGLFGPLFGSLFGPLFGGSGAITPPSPTPRVAPGAEDHVAIALSRLYQQFRDKPKIIALVTVLANRMQYVENAFWALLTQRSIAASVGAQLDAIGDLLDQPRAGLDDAHYRPFLFAKAAVLRSSGLHEQLLAIARLVLQNASATLALTREGTATLVMRVGSVALTTDAASVLAKMLAAAKLDGVRLLTESSQSIPANTFRFDSGPGWDVGHLAGAIEGAGS